MRLATLALLLAVAGGAAGQPGPTGETVTEVHADDVTVRPGRFSPMPLLVRYSYVPPAAAASQGPTLVNLTLDVGDGLVVSVENESLALEVPVDPRATPATGATSEAVFQASVYCHLPYLLTFPVGQASIVVAAEARENGLLKPSRGVHEVVVTCEDDRPTAPAGGPPAKEPPAPTEGGEKESPLGPLALLALAGAGGS
ncbi:MAG TPA: hypothetical protein VNX21_07925, partial [Candidatus Thermoplasmatota archaeon]|nr:hypothetical protein [Candidatus Thermoplasmatota archaeon]